MKGERKGREGMGGGGGGERRREGQGERVVAERKGNVSAWGGREEGERRRVWRRQTKYPTVDCTTHSKSQHTHEIGVSTTQSVFSLLQQRGGIERKQQEVALISKHHSHASPHDWAL